MIFKAKLFEDLFFVTFCTYSNKTCSQYFNIENTYIVMPDYFSMYLLTRFSEPSCSWPRNKNKMILFPNGFR